MRRQPQAGLAFSLRSNPREPSPLAAPPPMVQVQDIGNVLGSGHR